jgi:hypothetical protein
MNAMPISALAKAVILRTFQRSQLKKGRPMWAAFSLVPSYINKPLDQADTTRARA